MLYVLTVKDLLADVYAWQTNISDPQLTLNVQERKIAHVIRITHQQKKVAGSASNN